MYAVETHQKGKKSRPGAADVALADPDEAE